MTTRYTAIHGRVIADSGMVLQRINRTLEIGMTGEEAIALGAELIAAGQVARAQAAARRSTEIDFRARLQHPERLAIGGAIRIERASR